MKRRGYCIFINTICEGAVPSVTSIEQDDSGHEIEQICVFPTELEAQHEIVDQMMIRLQQFLDGERDFEDALTLEEYIVEVDVLFDGKIMDADGNCYG